MRSKGLAHEHKRRPVICVYTMFANLSRRQPQRLRLRHAPQVLAVKRERGSCADVQSQIHGGRSEGGVTRLLCRSLPPPAALFQRRGSPSAIRSLGHDENGGSGGDARLPVFHGEEIAAAYLVGHATGSTARRDVAREASVFPDPVVECPFPGLCSYCSDGTSLPLVFPARGEVCACW